MRYKKECSIKTILIGYKHNRNFSSPILLEELIEPAEPLAKYIGLCSEFNFLQNQPPAGAVERDRKEWRFCIELQKINLVLCALAW